jgi:hypothetical protein
MYDVHNIKGRQGSDERQTLYHVACMLICTVFKFSGSHPQYVKPALHESGDPKVAPPDALEILHPAKQIRLHRL